MQNFHLIVPKKKPVQPLGEILRQARLISHCQIEEALKEQLQDPERRIGEILASKRWLKQETADFFAEQWLELLRQEKHQNKYPLGFYLKQAALLDEYQINELIAEQNQGRLWTRVGALAVLKGWLNQSTVDYFVEHLYPEYADDSPFVKPKIIL